MAGRGQRILANLQKVREQRERAEQKESQSEASTSDAPISQASAQPSAQPISQSQSSAPITGAGRGMGRGKLVSALVSLASRDTSPPRESSSSSSSDQPSPSGSVSPPTEELRELGIDEPLERQEFPKPPDDIRNKQRGTEGRPFNMALNSIKLIRDQQKGIFLYSVSFVPNIELRRLRSQILRQKEVEDQIGSVWQFTGMNIYIPFRFDETKLIDTTTPVDGSPVRIKISYIKDMLDHPIHELLPFFNTTFRKIMRELKLVQIQRHYYDPTARIEVPQHKLEIWPGWATAIQNLDDGLILTCDASHRLLRTQTAKEILMDLFKLPEGRAQFKENAKKRLLGCVVLTRYNNRPYRVDDLDFTKSPLSTFEWNGREVTFVEYFKQSWNLQIKDEKQPLIVHRPKPLRGQTTEQPPVCLIPEFCYLTGLTDDLRSDTRVMKDISSHTRISPGVRQAKLQQFITSVLTNESARRHLTNWGLDLAPKPYETTARTMAPNQIVFGNDQMITVSEKADWSRDATNKPLFHTINVRKWLIVFTKRDSAKVDDFIKTLKIVSRLMGFTWEDPVRVESHNDSPMAYVDAIKKSEGKQYQVIVCMTPGSSQREDRYNAIKRLCYCEIGVPNQVVRANTLSDTKMRSVCQKIAIQMLCKIGGQPWGLRIPFKTAMIVGLDVYHDPTQKGKSIVGMVSSVDVNITHWYSRVFHQNAHEEIVNTLESGIAACLRKYHEVNNSLPQRIFIYRDGVSDGQIQYVLDFEVTQLLNALQDFGKAYEGYNPKLSVIVVQKRINAKLYLKRPSNELANPPPGSVLDHSITRRNFYDFYLISQHVTQGTVTPTHYIVVHDTNEMPPDRMQKLSYIMTHLYYNWFGTIRVPAPCQYAHKAAAMVGQVIKRSPQENLADKLYFL